LEEVGIALAKKEASILEAAKKSFLARGYGAVSMDAIAREAGVSKATVYAHFAGKEELFGAVIGDECERRFAAFSARELDARDPASSLRILAHRFLDLILSPDALALQRIILGEVTRFPILGDVFWRSGPERNLAQIEAFMKRAAAAGTLLFEDARLAAEQFIGLVRGEIQLRHLLGLDKEADEARIESAAAPAVATFLKAFRPCATEPPVP
jgi:TetR/AcrR family transcriptional regulator, mexJK operon transcriptional repressor